VALLALESTLQGPNLHLVFCPAFPAIASMTDLRLSGEAKATKKLHRCPQLALK
jgi:hypothetical protein